MEKKTKKICFLGGPSTGKSTLARHLTNELIKKNYTAELVGEFAREFIIQNGGINGAQDQLSIIRGQKEKEKAAFNRSPEFMVCDVPTFLSHIYFNFLNDGVIDEKEAAILKNVEQELWKEAEGEINSYDFVFFLPPELQPEHDGVRLFTDKIGEISDRIDKYLHYYNIGHHELRGSVQNRADEAFRVMEISIPMHEVKDIKLAEQGKLNIELAEMRMGALMKIKERFLREKPLSGIRVGMALHVTKETAVLVKTLIAGGADVAITGCNPLSTQDDVAAALAAEGVNVWAYKGETNADYYRYLGYVIDFKPHITIDDGMDLVSEIHKTHQDLIPQIIGGCEETTTGIVRLKAMKKDGALKYPIIAVNDNKTKHLLDNYYGTGQSTLDGIIRSSNVLVAGKNVVIAGYGSCGKGAAMRAKGLGANVIVTEVANFPALQASYDGFRVMPMEKAASIGDIFITLTGDINVIRPEHIKLMKAGVILANSGHFDVEIDLKGLKAISESVRRVRPFLDEYVVNGKKIFVAGEGRLVNLAAAEGHPSEVMSTSFCGQALSCEYLVKNKGRLAADVIMLPEELDDFIAKLQLEAMNVGIDELTEEQKKYLASWQEGT